MFCISQWYGCITVSCRLGGNLSKGMIHAEDSQIREREKHAMINFISDLLWCIITSCLLSMSALRYKILTVRRHDVPHIVFADSNSSKSHA